MEFDFHLTKCLQDPSMLSPMAGSPFHGWIGFFSLSLFIYIYIYIYRFLCGSDSKESACSAVDTGSIPRWGRSPGKGKVYPLQYSCLENPHRQRSLVGYSPWDRKDSDMTEQLTHTHTHIHTSHFVYLSMDTGCFHILAIVNHAAVNIHGSACIFSDFVFFGQTPRSKFSGSYGSSTLIFWEASILFSTVVAPVYIPFHSTQGVPFLLILLMLSMCASW